MAKGAFSSGKRCGVVWCDARLGVEVGIGTGDGDGDGAGVPLGPQKPLERG